MSRRFFDAVTAARIPSNAGMVGGYVDGLYKWSNAGWARFPNAVKVRIAVFARTNDGHVLDVEQGNATPAQSVDWVLMRRQAGIDPSVYMNTSTWPIVRSAFRSRGVAEPHYWVAQYDGVATVPAGAVAKQYLNNEAAGYDLSIVDDYWPGIDPKPAPAPIPAPRPHKGADMFIFRAVKGGSKAHYLQVGDAVWAIATPEDENAYKTAAAAAGVPWVALAVSEQEMQRVLAAAGHTAA